MKTETIIAGVVMIVCVYAIYKFEQWLEYLNGQDEEDEYF